jgi:hypothetical protein
VIRRTIIMINLSLLQAISFGLRGSGGLPANEILIDKHLVPTIDWIKRAHTVTNVGGISKGYNLLKGNWAPAYPETTGYSIPTLLNAAAVLRRSDLRTLSLSLANYLLESTTPEGGVAHWGANSPSVPIVFDTGQVIFGWLAAYNASGEEQFLNAAKRSGDWLVAIQDPSGSWKMGQHLGVEKVIDTRVAWALLELYKRTDRDNYRQAAVNNLNWAIQQQNSDGWFKRCVFKVGEDPFTHTVAYTAEGLFESGILLGEDRYIEAAGRTTDALLMHQHKDGGLSSTFAPGWVETSRSSCLTGNCQIGLLWLRLFGLTGDKAYLESARKVIAFVARTQNLETSNPNIRGAIAGSYPIYGRYERFKYPNWAAKFFVDALLRLEELDRAARLVRYVG